MQSTGKAFDLFNGDADGICALIQLRLAQPKQAELITGVKRDIKLVEKISVKAGDELTVLDISMDKNKSALVKALDAGANVLYCDHHFAGDIPEHAHLKALIDTSADTCTSLLINHYLSGRFVNWAITAAYGDNLIHVADELAQQVGLNQAQAEQLKQLGIAINYNGYGATEDDLHIHPAELYQLLVNFDDPLTLIAQNAEIYQQLISNYTHDMSKADQAKVIHQSSAGKILCLPNQAWARRVSGVFGNDLANQSPTLAHAVLTELAAGGYLVSVRAPKVNAQGADELCMKFETGGGRKAAAGINKLADNELQRFFAEFDQQFTV